MLDWHHPQGNVAQAIEAGRSTYNSRQAANKLQLYSPMCLAELKNDIQSQITRFLQSL